MATFSFKELLIRRVEIAASLAHWLREWEATHRDEIGAGDAFAILPNIEDEARALIPAQIADEARWQAEWSADQAAKSAKASPLEPSPSLLADPIAAASPKPDAC